MPGKKAGGGKAAAATHTHEKAKTKPVEQKKQAGGGRVDPAPGSLDASLSISLRRFDYFFVVSYLVFFAVLLVVFITRCRDVLPSQFQGYEIAEEVCGALHIAKSSMRGILDSHREWSKLVYTAKTEWVMDVVHRVNLFFTGPFSVVLAWGFFMGSGWAKNLGLLHSAVMIYNMVLVDLIGWNALHSASSGINIEGVHNPASLFAITYGFFTLLPMLTVWRLRGEKPFGRITLVGKGNFIVRWARWWLKLACWVLLAATLISYYEFTIKNVEGWRDLPSVVDTASGAWADSAAHREFAVAKGVELTDVAAKYATSAGVSMSQAAESLGNRLLEMAQGMKNEGPTSTK